jgi:hypothetical protein
MLSSLTRDRGFQHLFKLANVRCFLDRGGDICIQVGVAWRRSRYDVLSPRPMKKAKIDAINRNNFDDYADHIYVSVFQLLDLA